MSRRMREFAVRVSIGATRGDLVAEVMRSSARLLIPGLVGGLLLAAAVARVTRAVFVGVDVLQPSVYAAVALAQCAIVVVACLGPALRASRIDPLVALRE
jgi:ABC-type antimicrobial peptide transport system permease subunit